MAGHHQHDHHTPLQASPSANFPPATLGSWPCLWPSQAFIIVFFVFPKPIKGIFWNLNVRRWSVVVVLVQEEQEAEELKQALLRAALELESTRAAAQEGLRRMEGQALHLAGLLETAVKERDEARSQCHGLLLLLERQLQQQQQQQRLSSSGNPVAAICNTDAVQSSCVVDEGSNAVVPGSSSSEESSNTAALAEAELEAVAGKRELPEKGRLVEAVMGAGPLLQTLLLAGPLPQWRHPPPALHSLDIPPVSINVDKSKRVGGSGDAAALLVSPSFSSPPPAVQYSSSPSSPENHGSGKDAKIVRPCQL